MLRGVELAHHCAAATVSASTSSAANTATAVEQAAWGEGVTVTLGEGTVDLTSNGIPNHPRDAKYASPRAGVTVPDASTAAIADDPTKEQDYNFTITTTPTLAEEVPPAPLGSIGLMISGAVLFKPYEGDNTTVAMTGNSSLTDADGTPVWFVDSCSGHPTPMDGRYHYHGLPSCVSAQADSKTGPPKLIGVALDGFPIYGPGDINGETVDVNSLDECNGITSPTPAFPGGIYPYVLPGTSDETSSIRCFRGEVDSSQIMAMPSMGTKPAHS